MANMIIKPAADGNLILQDRAGAAVLTTSASGASLGTITGGTITGGTLQSGVTFPAGNILQVVCGFFTEVSSTVTSTTMTNTNDYVDITITAGNKVLVLYSGSVKGNEGANGGNDFIAARWGIKRDETAGPSQTDSQIVDQSLLGYSSDWTSHSGFWTWPCNCNYLDTPTATTTGLRYYVTIARYDHTNATSTQLYKTISGAGVDNKQRQLTLLEIQA